MATTLRGYSETELLSNRASVLIHGGTEDERRSWAEEAAAQFEAEGPLVEVKTGLQVLAAIKAPRGVVLVSDVTKLEDAVQRLIVYCLKNQEERPKLVIGVSGSVDRAREHGTLRDDLHYRLSPAQVDLQAEGLKALVAQRKVARRAVQAERAEAAKKKPVLRSARR